MANNSSHHQYLNHDWDTQLTMLKIIYDVDDMRVKYIDDENDEIGLNNSNDYKQAIQFAARDSNNLLKLVLKNTKGETIAKPTFKIDTTDRDLMKIINKEKTQPQEDKIQTANDKVLETDILANLPNDKKNWLINYLEQLKKDIVQEMETKIKDIVLSQSTVLLSNTNENDLHKSEHTDVYDMDANIFNEEKIKKLLNLLTEARLSERPIKVAFIEEELQLSGALNAVFVKDLTMPDGTKCTPGMKFQKKWLIKNTGRLAWNISENDFPVKLVCLAGNIHTQNGDFVNVETTNIDTTTIIGVDLVAPVAPGEYFSEWVLVCNGFKFGPRIWASIEVVDESKTDVSLSFRQVEQPSPTESIDDEFVVVPACFDLNKDWKSECNNLKKELNLSDDENQKEDQFKLNSLDSIESVNTAVTSRSIASQPLDIIVKQKDSSSHDETKTDELKSPSSFSSLNAFKDALSNVKMPSYVGDVGPELNSSYDTKIENTPKPLEITTNTSSTITSVSTTDAVAASSTVSPTQHKSIISPVSTTIANVSKTMYSAIGSLGSVYQSGESYMDKLIAMGFANRTLNNELLKKHNNNLEKVISELLERQDTNYRL